MESEAKNAINSNLCSKITHFQHSFLYKICHNLPRRSILSYFLKSWLSLTNKILLEFARVMGEKIYYFFEFEVILEVDIEKFWHFGGKMMKSRKISKISKFLKKLFKIYKKSLYNVKNALSKWNTTNGPGYVINLPLCRGCFCQA